MRSDPLYASLRRRMSVELSKPCTGRGGDSYRVRTNHAILRDALGALGKLGRPRSLQKAQPDDMLSDTSEMMR